MKNFLDKIKAFKYKTVTAIGLVILFQLLYQLAGLLVCGYISLIFFGYLIVSTARLTYHGLLNSKKESGYIEWYIVAALVILFYLALVTLIVIKGILPMFG